MGNQTNILTRMILCALMAIGAWNVGIFLSRTFIQHIPYVFDIVLCLIFPMIIGAAFGFFWKSK